MPVPEFRRGAPAAQADASLRRSLRIRDCAQQSAVLWFADILARGLFRDLGYSSMNQYAQLKLGFSPSRTADFMALAKKLDRLPAIKEELASGRLGYTKAREIASVADAQTEAAWLEQAQTRSRRELEQTVKEARHRARQARRADPNQGVLVAAPAPTGPPATVPVRVGFTLTAAQHAHYEALLGRIQPMGNMGEMLLRAMEALVGQEAGKAREVQKTHEAREVQQAKEVQKAQEARQADGVQKAGSAQKADQAPNVPAPDAGPDPSAAAPKKSPRGESEPQVQIHILDCPTCTRASVATPRGERLLSAEERAMAYEDARIHEPGRPNRATIAPRVRREVLARDRHTCRRRGCGHTRGLHLHHLVPRAKGGGHDPENLVTLCGACHRLWHERGGDLLGMLVPVGVQAGDSLGGDVMPGGMKCDELQLGDPQTGDLQTGDPQTGDLQTGDLQTGDLQTGDLQTGDRQIGDPQTGGPQTGGMKSGVLQPGDLKPQNPLTGHHAKEPSPHYRVGTGTGGIGPGAPVRRHQAGEPQAGEPQAGEPQAGRTSGPRPAAPNREHRPAGSKPGAPDPGPQAASPRPRAPGQQPQAGGTGHPDQCREPQASIPKLAAPATRINSGKPPRRGPGTAPPLPAGQRERGHQAPLSSSSLCGQCA